MAQVNFRVDDTIKARAEQACSDMGLTMTAAINLFLTKVANERRIPFEISADPFYSAENVARLKRAINDLNAGKGTVHEVDYD